MDSTNRLSRLPLLLGMLFCAAFSVVFIAKSTFVHEGETWFTLFDDAMISMRYAKNLVNGFGLVWNPGGLAVEGYTNFLWTLWMAILHVLPVAESKISLTVMLTSVILLGVILFSVWRIHEKLRHPIAATAFSLACLATYYPLYFWSLRGMEVGALAALASLSALQCLDIEETCPPRSLWWVGIFSALGVLIRMDYLVLAIVFSAFAAYVAPAADRAKAAATTVGPAILALVALTIFRWGYYDDLLPNTYYLKMTGTPLATRAAHGLLRLVDILCGSLLGVALGWLVAIPALLPKASVREKRFLGLLVAAILSQLAYSVYVGGDAWEWAGFSNRYITVAAPFFFIIPAMALSRSRLPVVAVLLLVAFQFAIGQWTFFNDWHETGGTFVQEDMDMTRMGLRLRRHTSAATTIAVTWAGAIPYFAERTAFDILGKNDRTIARTTPKGEFAPGHDKWESGYMFGLLKPDVAVQVWGADNKAMQRYGYFRTPEKLWVKTASATRLYATGGWKSPRLGLMDIEW